MAIMDKLHHLRADPAIRILVSEWAFSILFGCVNVAVGVMVWAVWLAEQEKKKKANEDAEKRGQG